MVNMNMVYTFVHSFVRRKTLDSRNRRDPINFTQAQIMQNLGIEPDTPEVRGEGCCGLPAIQFPIFISISFSVTFN